MTLVEYTRKGRLATVTLNRPEKLNALSPELLAELREAWIRFRDDEDAWVAILTGAGRAFCAGADRSWFEAALRGEDAADDFLAAVLRDPYWSGELDKPTIVAVNGPALGAGVDLVLRGDLRVTGEGATFRLPEVELGSVLVLWDNLPYAIAAELASGGTLTAERAHQVGMVNKVVPDDEVLDSAIGVAEELLSRPPLALRHALRIVREMKSSGAVLSTSSLRRYTTDLSRELSETEDSKEAARAFLAKRTPVFKGR